MVESSRCKQLSVEKNSKNSSADVHSPLKTKDLEE